MNYHIAMKIISYYHKLLQVIAMIVIIAMNVTYYCDYMNKNVVLIIMIIPIVIVLTIMSSRW